MPSSLLHPLARTAAAVALLGALPTAHAIEVVPWTATQRDGVVMQEEDLSCGAAAVAMVAQQLYGHELTEAQALQAMKTQGIAATVKQMLAGIEALGYTGRALTLKFEELARLKVPVILFIKPPLSRIDMGHFVVLTQVTPDGVAYKDPSYGHRVLAEADFRGYWETRGDKTLPGIAIAVLPKTEEQRAAAARYTQAPVSAVAPMLPIR